MTQLLMPKATAVWLIDNTALTFDQIGDFCNLHPLEVQAIADGEIGAGMQGYDPVANSQISREELSRCEADSEARLKMAASNLPQPTARTKGPRYVPVARRGDKPDAIAWLAKHHPELSDAQIGKLIGADWLLYQDLEDLIACVNDVNPDIEGWECSVFTGEYITGDVDAAYLNKLEAARNDEERFSQGTGDFSDNGIIDLYNDED